MFFEVQTINEPVRYLKELLSIFLLRSIDLFRVILLQTKLQKKETRDEYNLMAVSLLQMDARPINVLTASGHSLKLVKMMVKSTPFRGEFIYVGKTW